MTNAISAADNANAIYAADIAFVDHVCFWETADLPLPTPNILPKARVKGGDP